MIHLPSIGPRVKRVGMMVRQYTYFALSSEMLTAAEIERRIGVAPDEREVRGERQADPPQPLAHSWKVRCDLAGLTVDEQVNAVISRLAPHTGAIRELVVEMPEVHASLNVVRYFDDEGKEEDLSPVGGLEKLPGQHQLLGWHLDSAAMRFLLKVGAELDFDEYG